MEEIIKTALREQPSLRTRVYGVYKRVRLGDGGSTTIAHSPIAIFQDFAPAEDYISRLENPVIHWSIVMLDVFISDGIWAD